MKMRNSFHKEEATALMILSLTLLGTLLFAIVMAAFL